MGRGTSRTLLLIVLNMLLKSIWESVAKALKCSFEFRRLLRNSLWCMGCMFERFQK